MPLPLLAHLWLAAAGLAPPELALAAAVSREDPPGQATTVEAAPSEAATNVSGLEVLSGLALGNAEGNELGFDAPMPSELMPGEVDAVELPWWYAQSLRELAADDATGTVPAPWVSWREIVLRPVEGGFLLEGRWTIVAERSGWIADQLLGPGIELRSATLDGKLAPVVSLLDGARLFAWIEGPGEPSGASAPRSGRRPRRGSSPREVELRVRAFVPGGLDDRLALGLLPATRGRLRVEVPGRVPVLVTDEITDQVGASARLEGDVVWSGAPRLLVRLHDPASAPPPARDTLAVAHVGLGLTVGDAEVRGRAHVQWELRQGELSRVQATLTGVGDDLTVEGPSVATWSRNGDALDVELNAPVSGRVDLELRWTQAIGAGEETRLPLPRIEPAAWRSESSLQLARDGELEVIPEVEQGTAITAAALPEWGQGLVEGTPTAAYQHGSGPSTGHLDLLRFVPVPGPPTVIDVADTTIATTDEGRVLMKVRYDVRNDRAAHLAVRPPPGLRIIGARVGVETALPSKGDDEAWRIPLRRSLETVDGLLSFPVEVILLGEQDPWERRERRELLLPTLDAPIAASRVKLFLPPRYRSRLEAGERNVVDRFDEGEGLAYGRGVSGDQAAVADALLEEAVQGYLSNDFEQAQQKLDEIEALGVDNANVARLRSNIDVIEGKGKSAGADKADVALERRVKEQAKVRAVDDFRKQEELIAEAERAAQAGDYAQAESQYQAALDLGGKLAKLEQSESVEQVTVNTSVQSKLGSVSARKKADKLGKRSWKKGADHRNPTTGIMEADEKDRWPSVSSTTTAGMPGAGGGQGSVPSGGVEQSEAAVLEPAAANGTPVAAPAPDPAPDPVVTVDPNEPMSAPEPTEGEPLDIDADSVIDVADTEVIAVQRSMPGVMGRRARGPMRVNRRIERKSARGVKFKRDTKREPAGTAVYDFADDAIDGAALTRGGNAPLPAPEVTASALSVIVPVTGQAVLYQQLLIEANQTQAIEIHARRRLRR